MPAAQQAAQPYRADIDGLRAIAVLAVVAFHGGFERLAPGGFIGVDVFFVISGFLITRLIYDGVQNGTYSIADFYNRRARRILPALTVMLLFCLVAGGLIYFATELDRFQRSVAAASLFVANVLFYNIDSYFEQGRSANPLLHTWSLSVEEQFYILFPLIVWGLRGLSAKNRVRALAVLAALSFAAAVAMVEIDKRAAFYLTPYRAWELLLGALVSQGAVASLRRRWVAEGVGAAGLLLILAAVAVIDKTTPFPGWAALAPCLGAAAVIHSASSRQTLAARALGCSPMRFIGLVSYSLYLWHWPLIVFGKLLHEPRGGYEKLAILVVAFLAAVLSWRFVERPFRHKAQQADAVRTLRVSSAVIASTCLVAVGLGPLNRSLLAMPAKAADYLATIDYDEAPEIRTGACFLSSDNTLARFDAEQCLGLSASKKNVLIIGDSHAAHLWPGFHIRYPNVNFLQATASGCKPLTPFSGEKRCTELMRFVMSDFLTKHRLDAIILSARWRQGDAPKALATASALRSFADRVVISGPVVEYTQPLPRVLAMAVAKGEDTLAFSARYRRAEVSGIDEEFKRRARPPGIEYVSLISAMCETACLVFAKDGRPLQFDYGHFTQAGSEDVADLIGPATLGGQKEE